MLCSCIGGPSPSRFLSFPEVKHMGGKQSGVRRDRRPTSCLRLGSGSCWPWASLLHPSVPWLCWPCLYSLLDHCAWAAGSSHCSGSTLTLTLRLGAQHGDSVEKFQVNK